MPVVESMKRRLEAEKTRLLAEAAEVAGRPAEYRPTVESWYGNHLADLGTETFEGEKAVALEAHLRGILTQIDVALHRIDAGTYGTCETCGAEINPDRLDALPWATKCVTCQSAAQHPHAPHRS